MLYELGKGGRLREWLKTHVRQKERIAEDFKVGAGQVVTWAAPIHRDPGPAREFRTHRRLIIFG